MSAEAPAVLTPDICVIGAGSGGLTVAAAAAAFGVSVVLIERGRMGGDCLNTGCVPSKALIAAARHAHAIRRAAAFGIDAGEPRVDYARVSAHVHGVIAAIAPHDSVERFEGLGVTVIQASARFTAPDTVVAGTTTIKARRFVIATGSRAGVPPIAGLSDGPFLTNESVFDLTQLPQRLAVIGGGPIGMELAQAFRRLGSAVTVLEAGSALAKDDPELTAIAKARLVAEGVTIRERVAVERVTHETGLATLTVREGDAVSRLSVDQILVAAGRRPNVEDLGLETAGIAFDRTGVHVDRGLRTANRKVYAIGDVASVEGKGGLQFTHVAGWHAGLVVRSILFRLPITENRDIVPWATYTDPEIAQVGLSEAAARARFGTRVQVLRWPYAQNDRAQADRETEGLIKLVVGPGGVIIGAGIVGHGAGDMANLWSLVVSRRMKLRHLTGFISPYPTLPEIGKRAAISAYAASVTSPWLRGLVRLLQKFG